MLETVYPFTIIGFMSGTSSDGLDACPITFHEDGTFTLGEGISLSYTKAFQRLLKAARYAAKLSHGNRQLTETNYGHALKEYLKVEEKVPEDELQKTLEELAIDLNGDPQAPITFGKVLSRFVELHAQLIQNFREKEIEPALAAIHGQTLFHNPNPQQPQLADTWQLFDPALFIQLTGLPAMDDFRSLNVKLGGQGAPLAPKYHEALAKHLGISLPVFLLNIGGISNITVLDKIDVRAAWDTGVGNFLLDKYLSRWGEIDLDGQISSKGQCREDLLKLLDETIIDKKSYHDIQPPKSLDVSDFIITKEVEDLIFQHQYPKEDVCATLAYLTAKNIVDEFKKHLLPEEAQKAEHERIQTLILMGGGSRNPTIFKYIQDLLAMDTNIKVVRASDHGIDEQYVEAQIFAYLGYLSLNEKDITSETLTGKKSSGGHLHLPPNYAGKLTYFTEKNPHVLNGYADLLKSFDENTIALHRENI